MGRTFGLLIVSIGLWLVVSLPTRGPAPDRVAGAKPEAAPSASMAGATVTAPAANSGSSLPSVTATAAVHPLLEAERAQQSLGARPRRVQDERTLAARSREIEAEPEAALARPPEPSLVANGASGTFAPSGARTAFVPVPVPVTNSTGTIAPAAASRPVAFTLAAPSRDPAWDKPVKVTIPVDTTNGQPRAAQPPVRLHTAPVTGTAVQPSRIVEAARRDLAAQQIAMAVVPPIPRSDETLRATQSAAPSSASAAATVAESSTAAVKRPRPAKPVALAAAPRQQRIRVTQNYAPPAYLGRVVVRYAPPVFVPSSGSFRRAQFRGDGMWDAIRRNGM